MDEKYIFVIDTRNYSGNFERAMTAYCTGRYGECGVDDDQSLIFTKEVGSPDEYFSEVYDTPDEHGCYRPTVIYSTPGWYNDGHGGMFKDNQQEVDNIARFPAYLSVAIFFSDQPTAEQMTMIIERSKKYAKSNNINITGFRVLKEETTLAQIDSFV